MQDFTKLKVWQRAHEVTLAVYRLTADFPRSEAYGLVSQMRRWASSVGANIAEGCGRGSNADLARYLQTAMGSTSELQYHLLLSRDLEFLAVADHDELSASVVEIRRMLAALIAKLRVGATDNSRLRTGNSP